MTTKFKLELYFTDASDHTFAEKEKTKLIDLVKRLAPHIDLEIDVLIATNVKHDGADPKDRDYMPYHPASCDSYQSLLITNELLGPGIVEGRSFLYGKAGCIIRPRMEEKINKGGYSEDITIHEWIHTIYGMDINGRKIPNPHNSNGFPCDSEKAPNDPVRWLNWYKYLLRENY